MTEPDPPLFLRGQDPNGIGATGWFLRVHFDRIFATRKTSPFKTDTRTIPITEVTDIKATPNGRKTNVVLSWGSERIVVEKVPTKPAELFVDRTRIVITEAAARHRADTSPVAAVPSECPRCGADIHPKMKKCPYCSKPLA